MQSSVATREKPFQRQLGSYGNGAPLVICIGGIHGNEPAGALALQNVLHQLNETKPTFKGRLLALAGNVKALNEGVRYIHHDLNRMWSPERMRALPKPESFPASSEEIEQQELLAIINEALAQRPSNAIFLDLHTTSSDGAPFALISDTLRNRRLALQLPTPLILGLEESIEGTILNYINDLGHVAIGFEAGQHLAAQSIKNHEAAIWLMLVGAGCLKPEQVPALPAHRQTLLEASRKLPSVLEIRYRHAIQAADEFVMSPGFTNFHPVSQAQIVAADRNGKVLVKEPGYLFMPLYQKLGEDGFFLVREVKPFWLRVSAWLRYLGADRLLHWLPGVDYLPAENNSLVINTQIARWFVLEICHLLGFRKHTQRGNQLIVSRRKQSAEK